MTKTKILLLSVLSMLILVSSCKKDEDPIIEAEELVNYIETSITPKTLAAYIVASELDDKITAQTNMLILDIRSAEKWAAGHITGAVNVPDSKLLLDYVVDNSVSMDMEIYVVCYSGQTAAWGTALLRVAGYLNAKSLKFGMSSWTTIEGYDSWTGNVSDEYWGNMDQDASAAKPDAGSLPNLSEGFDSGANILDARLDAVFAEGFGEICATDAGTVMGGLYDNPNYFIINLWSEAHYLIGHIPNAVNYEPATDPFTMGMDLKTLPTDKTIIVYCYTGQGSAYVTAYLRLLGYDAKTLKFGANSMMNEHMPSSRWYGPLTLTPTVSVDRFLVVE
ncbi:MAG: rhodanese-like domain-containing protein [Bacteroidales bacterium]|nr:rhodanese-like domain-containing protein [Bacteroidales bacterium]